MGGFVDMSVSQEGQAEVPTPAQPQYPYGLGLCLGAEELEKLGLDGSCEVGDVLECMIRAKVTSVSKREMADAEPQVRVELQITEMMVESDEPEQEMPRRPKNPYLKGDGSSY